MTPDAEPSEFRDNARAILGLRFGRQVGEIGGHRRAPRRFGGCGLRVWIMLAM
jgi:hypothetical protein